MQQSTMSGEEKTTIVALSSMDDEMTTMRVDGWSFSPPEFKLQEIISK